MKLPGDSNWTRVSPSTGINFVCRNRLSKKRRGKAGGGVAIAFDAERCNLKKRRVKSKHEIVCVVGKIGKIERKFAIYSI